MINHKGEKANLWQCIVIIIGFVYFLSPLYWIVYAEEYFSGHMDEKKIKHKLIYSAWITGLIILGLLCIGSIFLIFLL